MATAKLDGHHFSSESINLHTQKKTHNFSVRSNTHTPNFFFELREYRSQ